ncbi:helix-turn-helix transcriptional regulator [Leucobacter coleopterorum]
MRHVRIASTAIRRFAPLRADVQAAAYLLRSAPAKAWTLQDLAESVHLSRSQLQVVFFASMGKTPFEYLKMVRVELMAKYLRESQLSVEAIVRLVGWRSRSHAASSFRQLMGMSPSEYRRFRAHLL